MIAKAPRIRKWHKPPDLPVSRENCPLVHAFLSKLAEQDWHSIDHHALCAIRHCPTLLSRTAAGVILRAAGHVLIEEVERRVFGDNESPRGFMFSASIWGDDPHSMQLVLVIWRSQEGGWVVVVGNVWYILGSDARNGIGDPFSKSPPDFAELEKIFTTLANQVMERIPAQYLTPAKI